MKDPRPHQSQDHEQCPEGHEDYFKPEECSWSIFIPEAGAVVRNGGYEVETEWEAHEAHPEDKNKSCRTRFHPAIFTLGARPRVDYFRHRGVGRGVLGA